MGLFTKRSTSPSTAAAAPSLASGRRLRSDQDIDQCIQILDQIMASYRDHREHFPEVIPCGHRWLDRETAAPDKVVCCDDESGDFLAFALWSQPAWTQIGLFPLGSGDERLTHPIVGHWKMRDKSLTSVGTFRPKLIALTAPVLPANFLTEMLEIAEVTISEHNVGVLRAQVGQMFLIKAYEFISSRDTPAANRFVDGHVIRQDNVERILQDILNDLAAWNPQVTPYIQSLPYRVRAILLARDEDGEVNVHRLCSS